MKNPAFKLTAIVVLLFLGLFMALQLKSINAANKQSAYAQQDLTELQDQVLLLIRENETWTAENQKLTDLIASIDADLIGEDQSFEAVIAEKQKAEIFAGLTQVQGGGLQIVMDSSTDLAIKSSTLLLLINEMRASKALAISVNEERIVALTEIRDTGSSNPQIVINGNSYPALSRFVIKAMYRDQDVGNAQQLLNDAIKRLHLENLATVSQMNQLTIPALADGSTITQPD